MTRYHGWHMVWALAVTQTVGFGVLYYAFSVFIGPMEAELGWSRAQTSGAFSLALLLSGVGALPAGRFVDKHGARGLMTLGSLFGALLVFAWSGVQSLAVFYLIQAAIGLVMATVLYDVAFTVIAVWFRRDRAKAFLVVTLVAGLASTIFIPLSTYLGCVDNSPLASLKTTSSTPELTMYSSTEKYCRAKPSLIVPNGNSGV